MRFMTENWCCPSPVGGQTNGCGAFGWHGSAGKGSVTHLGKNILVRAEFQLGVDLGDGLSAVATEPFF